MVWQLTALHLNVASEGCFNTNSLPGPVVPAHNFEKNPNHSGKRLADSRNRCVTR